MCMAMKLLNAVGGKLFWTMDGRQIMEIQLYYASTTATLGVLLGYLGVLVTATACMANWVMAMVVFQWEGMMAQDWGKETCG